MVGLQALRLLLEEYKECDKCPLLCESRIQPVFGTGSATADIVLVGESPGTTEDEDNSPFVGKSGRLLMQLLEMAWPDTDGRMSEIRLLPEDEAYFQGVRDYLEEKIFFTNAVLCRPEDRTPSTQEIKNCRDRLHKTIYAIDPTLIIATGKIAASTVLGKNVPILDKRGTIFDISVTSPATGREVRYPMLAVLHPSYLLRKGDKALVRQKKGDTFSTLTDLKFGLEILKQHYSTVRRQQFEQ